MRRLSFISSEVSFYEIFFPPNTLATGPDNHFSGLDQQPPTSVPYRRRTGETGYRNIRTKALSISAMSILRHDTAKHTPAGIEH